MIGYIRGKIILTDKNSIIVDNSGIGYEIFVKENLSEKLNSFKGEIELYIYTHFYSQECKTELYGFESSEEKELFSILISIPKIGPKVALAILTFFSEDDIAEITFGNQIDRLTSVPGIGKKSAERIILELKDKLKTREKKVRISDSKFEELTLALSSLGFSFQEINKIAEKIWKERNPNDTVEELIKKALTLSRKG